jgi:nucleoside-diphosphate kinase
MAIERTLSILKPDATRRNLTGKINAKFEDAGLKIVAQKRLQLTEAQAGQFSPCIRPGRSSRIWSAL